MFKIPDTQPFVAASIMHLRRAKRLCGIVTLLQNLMQRNVGVDGVEVNMQTALNLLYPTNS